MIVRSTDHAASDERRVLLIEAGLLPHPDASPHRETDETLAVELAKRARLTMPQLRAALSLGGPRFDRAAVMVAMRELGWLGTPSEQRVRQWAESVKAPR